MAENIDPFISVVMAVLNGERYVSGALDSILNQVYTNFEFIIINDGSSDSTGNILKSCNDNRIKIINHETNRGLVYSLNEAIDLSKGKYIVRMDADDICHKNRITEQVTFMEANPSIGVCGTFYKGLGRFNSAVYDFPTTDREIRCMMIFNSPIAHPTAILRKDVLTANKIHYSSSYKHAEDYKMWSLISEYSKLANLNKCLLYYRMHENQVSVNQENKEDKNKSVERIRCEQLNLINVHPSKEEFYLHSIISNGTKLKNIEELSAAGNWLLKIREANNISKILDTFYLDKILTERWLRSCYVLFPGVKGFSLFLKSTIFANVRFKVRIFYHLIISLLRAWKRKNLK